MEPELIVVGVDGSPGSVEALRWAAAEVGFRNARLRVVTTWEYPYAYTGIPDGEMMMPVGQIEAGARACLDSSVDDAIDDPRQREAVERLVVSGHPSHVLRKQSEHADMVVVGARGTADSSVSWSDQRLTNSSGTRPVRWLSCGSGESEGKARLL